MILILNIDKKGSDERQVEVKVKNRRLKINLKQEERKNVKKSSSDG